MISWKLWLATHTPFVAHPLYMRWGVWHQKEETTLVHQRLEKRARRMIVAVIIMFGAILHLFGAVPLVVLTFGLPFALVIVGIPLSLLIVGTFYGMVSASIIAMTIAREQYQGRFALMGLTHYGKAGAAWALGTISVQRHPILKRMRHNLQPIYFVIIFVLFFPFLLAWINVITGSRDMQSQEHAGNLTSLLLLVLFTIMDLVQSGNIGCLTGLLAPTVTQNPSSANALAIVLFSLIQVLSYALVAAICVFLWPFLGFEDDPVYYGLCVLTAYCCREILIALLWLTVLRRLDAEPGELAAIDNLLGLGFLLGRKTTW